MTYRCLSMKFAGNVTFPCARLTRNGPVLQWLPNRLQHRMRELRQSDGALEMNVLRLARVQVRVGHADQRAATALVEADRVLRRLFPVSNFRNLSKQFLMDN